MKHWMMLVFPFIYYNDGWNLVYTHLSVYVALFDKPMRMCISTVLSLTERFNT